MEDEMHGLPFHHCSLIFMLVKFIPWKHRVFWREVDGLDHACVCEANRKVKIEM